MWRLDVKFLVWLVCGSPDGKYVLTGGEDDLVQVWSMEDLAVVAWGEGHNSWVLDFFSFCTCASGAVYFH